MTALQRALRAEARKAIAARVPRIAGVLLIVGVVGVTASMTLDLGDAATLGGMKATAFAVTDAASFVSTADQVAAVASLLAFGVNAAWLVGREFVDGTVAGLFARATPRATVAVAKLVIHIVWTAVVSMILLAAIALSILLLGFGGLDAETWRALARLGVALMITGLLSTVAALVATLARGYLAAVGTLVGIVAVTQIAVIIGAGSWFPFAVPALWAMFGSTGASPLAVVVSAAAGLLLCAATVWAWARLRMVARS